MKLEALDLNLLVCLGHLLEQGSVSKAAEKMSVTQSTMSHRLSQLRDLFGDQLLVREGRAMVLTPLASELLPKTQAALSAARNLLTQPSTFDPRTGSGKITILSSDYEWATVILPIAAKLGVDAPGVDLRYMPPSLDALDKVAEGAVDFMLYPRLEQLTNLPEDVVAKARALDEEQLFEDEWVAVLREGHPAADGLTLEKLTELGHVLVSFRGGERAELDRVLGNAGLERRVVMSVPGFHMLWRTVRETDLVGMLPRRFAESLDGVVTLPHPAALARIPVCLWWHPRAMTSPRLVWFRDYLRSAYR